MPNDSGRQAGARQMGEIEITNDMEKAGAEAIQRWAIGDEDFIQFGRRAARDAFSAMYALLPSHRH
jgi:hypothetical protein